MLNPSPAAIALLALTSPAFSLEHPSGDKNADKRVCDVVYDPSDVVDVRAAVGEAVTIMFRASEQIQYVSASDAVASEAGRDKR